MLCACANVCINAAYNLYYHFPSTWPLLGESGVTTIACSIVEIFYIEKQNFFICTLFVTSTVSIHGSH